MKIKNKQKILGIIPARSNSKGITQKNIRFLNNNPLISYTIKAALKTKSIDRLITSTDSDEIAEIAIEFGSEVPFLRPKKFATDTASSVDVVLHTILWVEENLTEKYDYFVLLQPTSPLRNANHIDEAIKTMIKRKNACTLVSCTVPDIHPVQMRKINQEGYLSFHRKTDSKYYRRQEFPDIYGLNGAIYIAKWDYFKKYKTFYGRNCVPYLMDKKSSIDIDDEYDWKVAEYMISDTH